MTETKAVDRFSKPPLRDISGLARLRCGWSPKMVEMFAICSSYQLSKGQAYSQNVNCAVPTTVSSCSLPTKRDCAGHADDLDARH